MARVERVPTAVEQDFKPSAKIHRSRVARNADVSKISCAVARGNVHAPAESYGKMREVSADPNALLMSLGRGSIAPSMMIPEFESLMHIVADCLNALPATRDACKNGPGEIVEFLGITIAASEQVDQRVIRKPIDIPLLRTGCDFIRLSTVPLGSLSKAALVGAKTVKGPALDSALTRSACFIAATSVV